MCVIDALRGLEPREPRRYADAPCANLRPVKPPQSADDGLPEYQPLTVSPLTHESIEKIPPHGCPIWSACPRHQIDRDMVTARIWVANPASLLQSPSISRHLNPERLRRLELACLTSDIVIVDEVDRVQMQLDTAFAPSATLVTRGPDSWLDRLRTHTIEILAQRNRIPLSNIEVESWAKALDVVSVATNHIYAMIIASDDLRQWIQIDYFSAWTLQDRLVDEWYPDTRLHGDTDEAYPDSEVYDADSLDPDEDAAEPVPARVDSWAARRAQIVEILDRFRDNPLGDQPESDPTVAQLISLTQTLMHSERRRDNQQRLRQVLNGLLDQSPICDGTLIQPEPSSGERQRDQADIWCTDEWYDRTAKRLEFTLLLAVLHQRLTRVTFLWPQVEAALRLDATDNELGRRPPLDYAPMVPEAPMGNVLGFQFLPEEPEPGSEGLRSGTLRFFRCAGVGRELLLGLSTIGADPANGIPGPNVLLMSGTSWAGTSTRAHVMAPVTAVLTPSERSLRADTRNHISRTVPIQRANTAALIRYQAELTASCAASDDHQARQGRTRYL